jgi:hypothetical protein
MDVSFQGRNQHLEMAIAIPVLSRSMVATPELSVTGDAALVILIVEIGPRDDPSV